MSKYLQNALLEFIGKPISIQSIKARSQMDRRWFFKKSNPCGKLFSDISLLSIIQQSIQHNCYFAHPENVLLIMLGDDNKAIRAKAVNMISKIRRNNETKAHNHTSFESFIFPDAISMQNAALKSLTVMKKDKQLLPTIETIKEF